MKERDMFVVTMDEAVVEERAVVDQGENRREM